MRPPFQYQHRVRLHETDGAGILFYGQIFTLAHNAYEEMLAAAGISLRQILEEQIFAIPLAHAAADYLQPIELEEPLTLSVTVEQIGSRSFILKTSVEGVTTDGEGHDETQLKAEVTTVHITTSLPEGEAIPLPAPIQAALSGKSSPKKR
jgi:1,4-dihydroxy-2-naphthoyl-CoA hydrolase